MRYVFVLAGLVICALKLSAQTDVGLVAHFKFDENLLGGLEETYDAVEPRIVGQTINVNAASNRYNESDSAFHLNSDLSVIEFAEEHQKLRFNGAFTIAFWIDPLELPDNERIFFSNGGIQIKMRKVGEGLHFRLFMGGQVTSTVELTAANVNGGWMHIGFAFDGNNTSIGYLNGTQVTSNTSPSIPVRVYGEAFIGDREGDNTVQSFIDELRFYDRALDDSEFKYFMYSPLVVNFGPDVAICPTQNFPVLFPATNPIPPGTNFSWHKDGYDGDLPGNGQSSISPQGPGKYWVVLTNENTEPKRVVDTVHYSIINLIPEFTLQVINPSELRIRLTHQTKNSSCSNVVRWTVDVEGQQETMEGSVSPMEFTLPNSGHHNITLTVYDSYGQSFLKTIRKYASKTMIDDGLVLYYRMDAANSIGRDDVNTGEYLPAHSGVVKVNADTNRLGEQGAAVKFRNTADYSNEYAAQSYMEINDETKKLNIKEDLTISFYSLLGNQGGDYSPSGIIYSNNATRVSNAGIYYPRPDWETDPPTIEPPYSILSFAHAGVSISLLVDPSKFQHFSFVFKLNKETKQGQIKAYVDGVLKREVTGKYVVPQFKDRENYDDYYGYYYVPSIGAEGIKSPEISMTTGFNGLLDELKIYNRALTPEEVTKLLQPTPATKYELLVNLPDSVSACSDVTLNAGKNHVQGTTYEWSSGGVRGTDSTLHITESGTYAVKLSNPNTLPTDIVDTVVVLLEQPDLKPNFTFVVSDRRTVTFDNQTENTNCAIPQGYKWLMGNGEEIETRDVVYTYPDADTVTTYFVTLYVLDNTGNTYSISKEVVILPEVKPLEIELGEDIFGICPPYNLSATNNHVDGTTYMWYRDGQFLGEGQTTVLTMPGVYKVVADNSNTYPTTVSDSVNYSFETVTPSFEHVVNGYTITVTDHTSNTECEQVTNAVWDFGGFTAEVGPGSTVSQEFSMPGDYVIMLTVYTAQGTHYSTSQVVTVESNGELKVNNVESGFTAANTVKVSFEATNLTGNAAALVVERSYHPNFANPEAVTMISLNDDGSSQYEFSDAVRQGQCEVWYRIGGAMPDGSVSSYSEIFKVACKTDIIRLGESGLVLTPIQIFPNPVTSYFAIRGLETDSRSVVEVFNQNGTRVRTERMNGNTVNIGNLPTGFYVIKITGKDGKIGLRKIYKL